MKSKLTLMAMFFFFCSFLYSQNDIATTTLINVGEEMPAFNTTSLSGNSFSSDVLKGKVVLINFWATWCAPCKAEFPLLQKNIYDKIKNTNFAVLCISRGEKEDVVKKFIEQFKYSFPVYLDPDGKTYNLFASKYIPRNFVVGKDGKVKWASTGFKEAEFKEMIKLIENELKK